MVGSVEDVAALETAATPPQPPVEETTVAKAKPKWSTNGVAKTNMDLVQEAVEAGHSKPKAIAAYVAEHYNGHTVGNISVVKNRVLRRMGTNGKAAPKPAAAGANGGPFDVRVVELLNMMREKNKNLGWVREQIGQLGFEFSNHRLAALDRRVQNEWDRAYRAKELAELRERFAFPEHVNEIAKTLANLVRTHGATKVRTIFALMEEDEDEV